MKKESNRQKAETYVSMLSPFKKTIGLTILSGVEPHNVAKLLAKKNKKPVATYQAFVTMVVNGLNEITGGKVKGLGAGIRAAKTKAKNVK